MNGISVHNKQQNMKHKINFHKFYRVFIIPPANKSLRKNYFLTATKKNYMKEKLIKTMEKEYLIFIA